MGAVHGGLPYRLFLGRTWRQCHPNLSVSYRLPAPCFSRLCAMLMLGER